MKGSRFSSAFKRTRIQELADGGDIEAIAKKHKVAVVTLKKWARHPMKYAAAAKLAPGVFPKPVGNSREAIILLKQACASMPKDKRPTRSELLTMLALATLEGT
jgi:transposase-like protein